MSSTQQQKASQKVSPSQHRQTSEQVHSELDIYPQKLITTESRLRAVQMRLEDVMMRVLGGNGAGGSKVGTGQKTEGEGEGLGSGFGERGRERNDKGQSGQIKQCLDVQSDRGGAKKVQENKDIVNGIKTEAQPPHTSLPTFSTPKSNKQIQKLIQRWAHEDQIDHITREQMEKTVQFYQGMIADYEGKYQEMREYYAGVIERYEREKQKQKDGVVSSQGKKQINVERNSQNQKKQINQKKSNENKIQQNRLVHQNSLEAQIIKNSQRNQNTNLPSKPDSLPLPILQQNSQQTNLVNSVTLQKQKIIQQNSKNGQKSQIQTKNTQNQQLLSLSQRYPKEYIQLLSLQQKAKKLTEENVRIKRDSQEEINKYKSLSKELQGQTSILKEQLNNKIVQLQSTTQQLAKKVLQLQQLTSQNTILSQNSTQLTQKLQQKQKQLLKYIHSESNFAAQQLTSLQAALILQKQQREKNRLQYVKKVQELEEDARKLRYMCQGARAEIEELKSKIQRYKEREKGLRTGKDVGVLSFDSITSQQASEKEREEAINQLASIACKSLIPGFGQVSNQNNSQNPQQSPDTIGKNPQQTVAPIAGTNSNLNINNVEKISSTMTQPSKNPRYMGQIPQKEALEMKSLNVIASVSQANIYASLNNVGLNENLGVLKKGNELEVIKDSIQSKQQLKTTGYTVPMNKKFESTGDGMNISKLIHNHMIKPVGNIKQTKNLNIYDKIREDFGQQNEKQVKFTKVLSIDQNNNIEGINNKKTGNTGLETTQADLGQNQQQSIRQQDQPKINMNIINQVLLVPLESIDGISTALLKLQQKLDKFKNVVNNNKDNKMIKSSVERTEPKEHGGRQGVENQPNQNKDNHLVKANSNLNVEEMNRYIYQLAKQLGYISNSIVENFQDQIIKVQSQGVIQMIKKAKEEQKTNKKMTTSLTPPSHPHSTQITTSTLPAAQSKQVPEILQVQPKLQQSNATHSVKKILQQNNMQVSESQHLIQTYQDYNKAFKMINNELKQLFQSFFNDNKIALEEQDSVGGSTLHIGSQRTIPRKSELSGHSQQLQAQQKTQDQKSILAILKKLSELHTQLMRKRKQISAKNKQRVERIFDVIRSMIINFKISYKSMNNILITKQLGQTNRAKYMHLRTYLTSLYKILQTEQNTRLGIASPQPSPNQDNSATAPKIAITLYESYEDKVEKLSNQLSKVRLELDHKIQQIMEMKEVTAKYLQVTGMDKNGVKTQKRPSNITSKSQSQPQPQPQTLQIPPQPHSANQETLSDQSSQKQPQQQPQQQQVPIPETVQQLKQMLINERKRRKEYQSELKAERRKAGGNRKIIRIRK